MMFAPDVLDAWRTVRRLDRTRDRHFRADRCPQGAWGHGHCPDCRAWIAAVTRVSVGLGLKPWEPCPTDGGDPKAEQLARLLDAAIQEH